MSAAPDLTWLMQSRALLPPTQENATPLPPALEAAERQSAARSAGNTQKL
jgi:hypothetical protein